LTHAPISKRTGQWNESFLKIAVALRMTPASLVPEQHLKKALKKSSVEMELSVDEVRAIMSPPEYPEDSLERRQAHAKLVEMMNTLKPREERILRERFGFNGEIRTLDNIADDFGVTKSRIREIEMTAIRRLKSKYRMRQLSRTGGYDFIDAHEENLERWKREYEKWKEERRNNDDDKD